MRYSLDGGFTMQVIHKKAAISFATIFLGTGRGRWLPSRAGFASGLGSRASRPRPAIAAERCFDWVPSPRYNPPRASRLTFHGFHVTR